LLAWDARDGSKNIQAYMLSILPPGATTTRSLGSDLTNEQVAARKAVNAGRSPNKRRKAKREAEARGTNNVDKKDVGKKKAGKKVTKITMQKSAGISKKRKPANIAYEPEKHKSESG